MTILVGASLCKTFPRLSYLPIFFLTSLARFALFLVQSQRRYCHEGCLTKTSAAMRGTLLVGFFGIAMAQGAIVTLQNNALYDYTGTSDAWLNEETTGRRNNYGGATNLIVRYDSNDGGYIEDCTVIRFHLPMVVCSGVHTAELALFYRKEGSMQLNNVMGLKPYRLTNDWDENTGTGDREEGVSWRYRDRQETKSWTWESGGWHDKVDDGNSEQRIKKSGGSGEGIPPLNWVPFNVRPSVLAWTSGQTNCGFVLFSSYFTGNGSMVYGVFDSRNFPNPDTRPKLTIGYSNAVIRWEGAMNGNWSTSDVNWRVDIARARYENGDHVLFEETTRSNLTLAAGGVTPASTTFSNNVTSYTLAGGPLLGSGPLYKHRNGDLRLAASNGFSGAITVTGGRLIVAHQNALGSPSSGTEVREGASLVISDGILYQSAEPLSLAGNGWGNAGAMHILSGTGFFYGPITFTASASVGAPTGSLLALMGSLEGAGNWTKIGSGTLALGGATDNTCSGTGHVAEGTLYIQKSGSAVAIPGLLRIGGATNATVELGSSGSFGSSASVRIEPEGRLLMRTYSASVTNLTMTGGEWLSEGGVLTLRGDFSYTGTTQGARLSGGVLSLDGALRTVTIADGPEESDVLVETELTNGGIIKAGNGRLTLRQPSTYTLGTVVLAGSLRVENSTGSGTGSGTVIVQGGGALEGTGRIQGTVVVQDDGWIRPGSSAGTLTVGSLVCSNAAGLVYDLNAPGYSSSNDFLVVQGNATVNGRLVVQAGPGFTAGSYPLLSYTGTLELGPVAIEGVPAPYDAWLATNTPGVLILEVAETPDHYVSPDGGNIFPYTNWATAARILQNALDVAQTGDTVWVAAGVYSEGGRPVAGSALTNRALIPSGVTLRSVAGPARTVIVGQPDPVRTNGPAAIRGAWLQPGSALIGFTLSNGFTAAEGPVIDRCGGGAYAQSAVISQCWFVGNGAIEGGGATLQEATLAEGRFWENRAASGGALVLDSGSKAVNSLFYRNTAVSAGGAIWALGNAQLRHLTIARNNAGLQGGGVACESGTLIQNSILYFNQAPAGQNLYCKSGLPSVSYSCLYPAHPGPGNTEADPEFQNDNDDNFHLRYGSPCLDRAAFSSPPLTNDLDGVLRPLDGDYNDDPRPDMGAFEYDGATTDTDGDDIPDDWEHRHGLDPRSEEDRDLDYDGDSYSNWAEYVADTDPFLRSSYLQIVAVSNTTPFTLWFDSSAHRLYRLLATTSLTDQVWTEVRGAGPTRGSGRRMFLQDTNALSDCLFYRLRVDVP